MLIHIHPPAPDDESDPGTSETVKTCSLNKQMHERIAPRDPVPGSQRLPLHPTLPPPHNEHLVRRAGPLLMSWEPTSCWS